ncbi:MAG: hypothetical protein CMN21_08855, partial [Rubinisphaera sp.]|nr:hypothetical protein [Rubinisphaera sp.]
MPEGFPHEYFGGVGIVNSCLQGVLLGLCSLIMIGCGGDGIDRVDVVGKVTLDGAPLNEGASITFIPVGPGPAAG